MSINGPIFLVIGAGFLAVRTGYVPAAGLRTLGDFVIRVALPALILASFVRSPLAEIIRPDYVAGYALGSLAAFALAMFVRLLDGGKRLGDAHHGAPRAEA